jgi:hypothetical protein
MQPQSRRIFTIAWTAGALIVLWCQIIAVGMPPVTAGSQRIILIGPDAVVLAALAVDFLILWLLMRRNGATDVLVPGKFNRLGRLVGIAAKGTPGIISDDNRRDGVREPDLRSDCSIFKLTHYRNSP